MKQKTSCRSCVSFSRKTIISYFQHGRKKHQIAHFHDVLSISSDDMHMVNYSTKHVIACTRKTKSS